MLFSGCTYTLGNPAVGNIHPHHHFPSELDVTFKSCAYNRRTGFAGDIGESFFTVEYFYMLEVNSTMLSQNEVSSSQPLDFDALPANSLENVVLQVEMEIASYLLRESKEFENAPCNGERRLIVSRQTEEIQNVGLTIGPDDEIVTACESLDAGKSCYLVAGYFQVHTRGTEGNTTISEGNILMDIKNAMDSGKLDNAHPAILRITYLKSLPSNPAAGATSGEADTSGNSNGDKISAGARNGPDAATIVSASVGAVLIVAAIAFVSRSRNRYDDQIELQQSSMEASEIHTSKGESEVSV